MIVDIGIGMAVVVRGMAVIVVVGVAVVVWLLQVDHVLLVLLWC